MKRFYYLRRNFFSIIMKTIRYFFITLLLIISSIFCLQAQTTTGKEFWLTFGDNANHPYTVLDLQIRIISGDKPTMVTIHFTNLGTSVTHSMSAQEVWNYSLDNTQKQAAYTSVMDPNLISFKSIYITSSEPVSAYALNYYNATCDATNILPVTALGTEYYLISYGSFMDYYVLVATKNNTNLYQDETFVVTLDSGQVYYKYAYNNMTGVHITTNYPVAFFAVHAGVYIPYYYYSSVSHLMQQLAPVKIWGKNFFVPSSYFNSDYVRIVVSQNNTTITQTGGIIQTVPGAQTNLSNLQAGDFVELAVSDTGCYIKADKPVGVCSFLSSLQSSFPAQCWIPAIEQTVTKVRIAPFIPNNVYPPYLTNHYALVCTPTGTKGNTRVSIGGALPVSLTGGSWIDNDTAKMSFYTMPLDNPTASYNFTNQAGLFILGYASGYASSYYYLAGSAMRDLDAAFYANNVHFQELPDTTFCDKVVNFRAEIENIGVAADSIKWYINGAEYEQARDLLQWSKPFVTGEYEIKMLVYFENGETLSKSSTLNVRVFWTKIRNVRY